MLDINKKIESFFSRKQDIENLLSHSNDLDAKSFKKLSKELSEITVVTDIASELKNNNKEVQDLEDLIKDKNSESEIKELAKIELKILEEKIQTIEKELEIALLPKDEDDERNVILEIRAGTGGDEAGLFASTLFNMSE